MISLETDLNYTGPPVGENETIQVFEGPPLIFPTVTRLTNDSVINFIDYIFIDFIPETENETTTETNGIFSYSYSDINSAYSISIHKSTGIVTHFIDIVQGWIIEIRLKSDPGNLTVISNSTQTSNSSQSGDPDQPKDKSFDIGENLFTLLQNPFFLIVVSIVAIAVIVFFWKT